MASYYFQNKEYDKAIELYEPLYKKAPNNFYYQMLYQCYMESSDFKSAESLVEKRIKKYPNDLKLMVDLGVLQQRRDNKKKAEKTFAAAVEKAGYDSKQVSDLALAFENIGRNDLAIETYRHAREAVNNKFLYVMELATLYEKSGEYDKMMQEYFDLLDNSPRNIGNIQISLQRALSQASTTQLADGLRRTLVSRIRQHPDNKSYLEMMIWFSLQQKDFEFALTQAKAVDARFPDQGGQQVWRVAQIADNNEAYDIAEQAYRYLVDKGKADPLSFDSRVALLSVKYKRLMPSVPAISSRSKMIMRTHSTNLERTRKPSR